MHRLPAYLLVPSLSFYACAARWQITDGSITGWVTVPSKATIAEVKVAAINPWDEFSL
jgi:hypothetical protein